jgi:Rrf2 family nitric oxide-sensitive transcriptional repressor
MISQTAEYALRAVVCLGTQGGRPLTTQVIADRTQVPGGYLAKVLQGLGRAGLVESQRGVGGGFILARPLDEITVLDVINAVDPLKRIQRCPLGLVAHGTRLCPLHRRLDEAIALVESLYEGTTIAQLLEESSISRPPGVPVCPGHRG